MVRIKHSKYLLLAGICLLVIAALSCTSKERYAGTYSFQGDNFPEYTGTVVELKDDGQGSLRTADDEEVTFRWSLRGHEIRFHTKEGGIIIGKIDDTSLEVTLPGSKVLSFKKNQPGL
jgi:hypothetical protein